MKRKVIFRPAFDKRNEDPSKNYGIGGVSCTMVLIGEDEDRAITFSFNTGIFLPDVQKELDKSEFGIRPMGYHVTRHQKTPQYEGNEPFDDCDYLGGECYATVSYIESDELFTVLREEGSEAVWEILEKKYEEMWEKNE